MRRRSIYGAAAAIALALSGCSFPPGACTTIGYIRSVSIEAEGLSAASLSLEACVEGECTTPLTDSSTLTSLYLERVRGDSWQVTFISGGSGELELRAVDGQGKVVAAEDFELTWTRTGGSEECGGPAETEPIVFSVD